MIQVRAWIRSGVPAPADQSLVPGGPRLKCSLLLTLIRPGDELGRQLKIAAIDSNRRLLLRWASQRRLDCRLARATATGAADRLTGASLTKTDRRCHMVTSLLVAQVECPLLRRPGSPGATVDGSNAEGSRLRIGLVAAT